MGYLSDLRAEWSEVLQQVFARGAEQNRCPETGRSDCTCYREACPISEIPSGELARSMMADAEQLETMIRGKDHEIASKYREKARIQLGVSSKLQELSFFNEKHTELLTKREKLDVELKSVDKKLRAEKKARDGVQARFERDKARWQTEIKHLKQQLMSALRRNVAKSRGETRCLRAVPVESESYKG